MLTRRSTKPATRKKGDIELLELIAKDPQAFILEQGWASVSLDGARGLMELEREIGELKEEVGELAGEVPF